MGEGSRELTQQATNLHVRPQYAFCKLRIYGCNGYLNKMASFVVQNACFSLNTRFWQCLILIQQASALPRICTRVFGSHCFSRFTTLETSVSRAKGIFKLRKIA